MSEQSLLPIAVQPVISYPCEAEVGKTYLMTIDLQVVEGSEWQFEEEEYPIYCMVDSEPLFSCKAVGEPAIVLHRFGGTYDVARFLLRAAQVEAEGEIGVTLVNTWGVPIKSLKLETTSIITKPVVLKQAAYADSYAQVLTSSGSASIRGTNFSQEYQQAERAYMNGRYEEAINIVDRLVKDYPQDPSAHLLCGHIYCYGLQQYSTAQEQYQAVLRLTSDREFVDYANKGIAYAMRSRKRPNREMEWLRAFEREVEARLKLSIHNQILINLSKTAQPEQVHRLWGMEIKTGMTMETIPMNTGISEVFDRADITGKLLILGKPGAGKTTTLLELARVLVDRAIDDPSLPMPFLLNLSSWKDPKQSIKNWTITELQTKGVGSKLAATWIEDQKVLLLLDGLDEVRLELQPICVRAINQFMSSETRSRAIVVCSRYEEYQQYPEKLNLNGAIYLRELSDQQIKQYLQEVDRAALWELLSTDKVLLELVRQPLLLIITLVAYREELAEQWRALSTVQELRTFLLSTYVELMLARPLISRVYEKEPTSRQTIHFLSYLAKTLNAEEKTEFLIEQISLSRLQKSLAGDLPWNLTRFLNYTTERMLMQRVGKRYRFIHKLLQDYFAQLVPD